MLDRKVKIPASAHLACTSPRMIIKNNYEPHSSEAEKTVALLPKLETAREAPLRLINHARPVQAA